MPKAQAKKINLNWGDTRYIISVAKELGLLRNQLAYALATTWHETAFTMRPIKEYGSEKYLRSKKYWPYIGMGYTQVTWKFNYEKVDQETGAPVVAKPELLLTKEVAAVALLRGLTEGWWIGGRKVLSDFVNLNKSDYVGARALVNGKDKAAQIAEYAKTYEALLKAEGYGDDPVRDQKPEMAVVADTNAPARDPLVITPVVIDYPVEVPAAQEYSLFKRVGRWLSALFS